MGLSIAFAARALIELAVAALAAKDGFGQPQEHERHLSVRDWVLMHAIVRVRRRRVQERPAEGRGEPCRKAQASMGDPGECLQYSEAGGGVRA